MDAGAATLFAAAGESVTYRGGSITVTIDRLPRPQTQGRRMDFDPRNRSSIFALRSALTTAPKAGETFTDSFGMKHRIESFLFNGAGWVCDCHTSGTPT